MRYSEFSGKIDFRMLFLITYCFYWTINILLKHK